MSKKRNVIYLICGVVFLFSVIVKQRAVTAGRNEETISAFSEWQQHGKPVAAGIARKKDVMSYTKVTAWQVAPDIFEGHVSRAVRDKLYIGQEMLFKLDDLTFTGVISNIADEISLDTGMFAVQVTFQETFDTPGWVVAYAHTDTIKDAINVPNEMIEKSGGQFTLWKVENGHAVKQPVTIQRRDGYGAVIESGIQEGDVLVMEGFTQLRAGDKVRVVKEYTRENKHD